MAYYSIPLEMAATTYIQAISLAEAHTKLECVLSKTIDARDERRFSDASFGDAKLPEISFATAGRSTYRGYAVPVHNQKHRHAAGERF